MNTRQWQSAVVAALVVGVASPVAHGQDSSTWDTIQSHIFSGNCTSCHQEGTGFARQSDLVLTPDVAYDQLINQPPANTAAREDGLVRVSTVGGAPGVFQSFLWEKINTPEQEHFYNDHPNYGALMPLGLPSLTNGELNFIGTWIAAGAPETGVVANMNLLNDTTRYEPPEFQPLEPPTEGVQLHLGPFEVWPAQEYDREFFYYQPFDTQEDMLVSRYEISYREGSHHFILYNYPDGTPPPDRQEEFRDLRNAQGVPQPNTDTFGLFPHRALLTTQTPYTNYQFPEGVALRVPAGQGFDLNVHSVNRSEESRPGEVYVNLHTSTADAVKHVAEPANFGNFDITLPPNQETTITKEFTFRETQNIVQLWSHAHEKMTEFRIEYGSGEQDGELIYWTNDWEHPPLLQFQDPLTFRRGDKVRISTTWFNDTDETVEFGLLSSDEMQFMFYIFYPGSPVAGDFDEDLVRDASDIDSLSLRARINSTNEKYDVTFDGVVDQQDRIKWVEFLAGTYFGDSNLDGVFDSADLVAVFTAGEYEDGIEGNSGWSTGDWDGDGEFASGDLVTAFVRGGYGQPARAAAAVPEPSAGLLALLALVPLRRRR